MGLQYKVLNPKNALYRKVEIYLWERTFNCGICKYKGEIFTDKSIIIKDIKSSIVHVLNYCPTCEQRLPVRVDLEKRKLSLEFPTWDDGNNMDEIYPRRCKAL